MSKKKKLSSQQLENIKRTISELELVHKAKEIIEDMNYGQSGTLERLRRNWLAQYKDIYEEQPRR